MIRYATFFVLASLWVGVIGCKNDAAVAPANEPAASGGGEDHGHSHSDGPNGGVVTDWGGGKYHVEFTVDHDAKESAVYILGGDAKTPEPIAAETLLLSIREPSFQVDLQAVPLDGESAGTSSRFVGKHDNLGIVREFSGAISGEVDGTPYAGDFQEEAHGHEH
ncbi:hypothetical protein M4951_02430 [Blastopirellula sp. J2-11]|uniref:hypothetical protein n=1 Tax=Blastopirellula sp. J2-11 TaxID=2943192 RepID=UPI0021C845DD|nr:hypothetical protein [Blastopirellula sp. J2-11]UUO07178.1 hypothetical protein M4951_02430 [Blastopirellula sp. J2-11]